MVQEQRHTRIEKENDFADAVTGFIVGFGFFFGIGVLAMVLQYVLS
jgi:hypothetical protein